MLRDRDREVKILENSLTILEKRDFQQNYSVEAQKNPEIDDLLFELCDKKSNDKTCWDQLFFQINQKMARF